MWKKIVRILAFPLGAVFGVGIVEALEGFANAHPEWGIALTPLATGVIYGATSRRYSGFEESCMLSP